MNRAEIGNGYSILDYRHWLPRHPNKRYHTRDLGGVQYIVVHHSAVAVDSSPLAVARYHIDSLGWPGIGYHFLVAWDGTTFYCNDLSLESYNVAGRNHEVIGVLLPGDFTVIRPGVSQLLAAKKLLAEIQFQMGSMLPIVGHRDIALSYSPTSCPGSTWESWKAEVQ